MSQQHYDTPVYLKANRCVVYVDPKWTNQQALRDFVSNDLFDIATREHHQPPSIHYLPPDTDAISSFSSLQTDIFARSIRENRSQLPSEYRSVETNWKQLYTNGLSFSALLQWYNQTFKTKTKANKFETIFLLLHGNRSDFQYTQKHHPVIDCLILFNFLYIPGSYTMSFIRFESDYIK